MPLLLLFIAVPLIEIALFIQLGSVLDLGWILLIVVLTAIVGTYLVRRQGRNVLSSLTQSFSDLRDPSEPLAHGAMILFSGALLLTPGFFTDTVGFLLLVPGVRNWVIRAVRSRIKTQNIQFATMQGGPFRPESQPQAPHDTVIDGDYQDLSQETPKEDRGPSGWTRH